jgi:hypothetical protein
MVIPCMNGAARERPAVTSAVGPTASAGGSGIAPSGRNATQARGDQHGRSTGIRSFNAASTTPGRNGRPTIVGEGPIAEPDLEATLP